MEAWRLLVAAAADFYSDDLMMGVREADLCGHWKDELAALEKGLAALDRQQREANQNAAGRPAPRFRPSASANEAIAPEITHQPVTTTPAGKPLTITAEVRDPTGVKWVRLRYRSANQHQDYRSLPMQPTGSKEHYSAVIPAEEIPRTWDLMYFIEAMDNAGNGRIHPDLNRETPYIVVHLQR